MLTTRICIYLTVWSAGLIAFAQSGEWYDSLDFPSHNKVTLKVDLANYINPFDPSLLVSGEFLIAKKLSFSQEVGIVTGARSSEDMDFQGWKIREELRWYFGYGSIQAYASANFLYRQLSSEEQYVVGYGCDDWAWGGGCDYQRNFRGNISTQRMAGVGRIGMVAPVWPRLFLETDVGLGVSNHRRVEMPVVEEGGRLMRTSSGLTGEAFGRNGMFTFTAKICYVLFYK